MASGGWGKNWIQEKIIFILLTIILKRLKYPERSTLRLSQKISSLLKKSKILSRNRNRLSGKAKRLSGKTESLIGISILSKKIP